MTGHGGGGEYKDLVVFLAAAGVMVPLFNRLKISPILGFLAAGVLLGPDGLARFADTAPWLAWLTISDAGQIRSLSELGVAFLLFMIGLELSWGRLKSMRRLVFGLGLTQVAACTVVLAALFMVMGQTLVSAAVLGMGLSLSSIFLVYTGESVARVFFITAAAFGGLSLYGYTTKKDLSGFGSFLIMGLFGIIIASIVNIFLASTALQFAISAIGVLVFAGLTAYDTQRIKEMYDEVDASDVAGKKAILGALTLYLDFINLFIMLLQLFGNRE